MAKGKLEPARVLAATAFLGRTEVGVAGCGPRRRCPHAALHAREFQRLKLRPRRVHELPHTMISITRDAGAPKDVVGLMTHTPKSADQDELYGSLLWATFREADQLRADRATRRRGGPPAPSGVGSCHSRGTAGFGAGDGKKKPCKSFDLQGFPLVGETGFEPATPSSRTRCSTRLSHSPIFLVRSHQRRERATI